MAATEKGVWDLQEVRDKQLASEWDYTWGGTLWAWGNNPNGVLGQNAPTPSQKSSPTQIGTESTWRAVGGSGPTGYVLGIKNDGTMWGWGGPGEGLGLGPSSPGKRSSPTQVGTGTNWLKVSKGGEFNTAAIKTDGTMWVWGTNESGKLGLNIGGDPAPNITTPVQVGSDTTWKFCSMSKRHALALKTDGTLWTWGQSGGAGALGLNNNTQYSSPVQIGTNTNWKRCVATNNGGAAINTSGQLFSWGYNIYGQGGHNDRTTYSSPKQVPGTWVFVDGGGDGGNSMMGLKSNGTLWAWGDAGSGQIDKNLYTNQHRSSPVQIGTETTWSTTENENDGNSGMMQHSACNAAMKTDGTWWTWGANGNGQLGINDKTGSPNNGVGSPRQLPGSWKIIGVSERAMWGIKG